MKAWSELKGVCFFTFPWVLNVVSNGNRTWCSFKQRPSIWLYTSWTVASVRWRWPQPTYSSLALFASSLLQRKRSVFFLRYSLRPSKCQTTELSLFSPVGWCVNSRDWKGKGVSHWTVFTYLIVGHLGGVWYLAEGYLEAYDLPQMNAIV